MKNIGKKCEYSGCDKQAVNRGYCDSHYHAAVRDGILVTSKRMNSKGKPSKHPLYRTWARMRSRCHYKNGNDYHLYGGRGIKVCDRWNGENGFWNFVEDMPPRPDGYSIDRIDVNGDYCPENCRWADSRTQAYNRRNNLSVIYAGRRFTVQEIAKINGQNTEVIRRKIRDGKRAEAVFSDGRKSNWEDIQAELKEMLR